MWHAAWPCGTHAQRITLWNDVIKVQKPSLLLSPTYYARFCASIISVGLVQVGKRLVGVARNFLDIRLFDSHTLADSGG